MPEYNELSAKRILDGLYGKKPCCELIAAKDYAAHG